MAPPSDDDLQQEMIHAVKEEKQRWEDALVFITENVAFKSRDLIKTLRKNYWGIYDNPRDPTTGRKKVWVPLSEQVAETHTKHTDFDRSDTRFKADNKKARPTTDIFRGIFENYADRTYLGQDMNQSNRQLNIDGTFVWKTIEENGLPRRVNVDLLNFYIDPMADSIQDADRVTERILMTPREVKSHGKWINTEDVEGSEDLQKIDPDVVTMHNEKSDVEYVDVWEMWGLVPRYFITGNPDHTEQVEAQIVVSGLEAGEATFHYAKRNTKKDSTGRVLKPYEECWHTKVQNRWYGRGPVEQVLMLQLWLNTVVNIRINRSFLTQMGVFKIRKGSGITPEQLQSVPQNGGIVVNSMEDIENFAIEDIKPSAYREENRIMDWAQRVTSAYDQVAGEAMPAETPATNASIQNENAKSTFKLVKQNIGHFMERWIDRHAKPILAKNVDTEEIIRITGDDKEIQRFYDRVIAHRASKELDAFEDKLMSARFRTPQDVERALNRLQQFQENMNKAINELRDEPQIFAKAFEDLATEHISANVYFTNEEVNSSVKVSNLMQMLQVAPEMKEEVLREAFNLMNMDQPDMEVRKKVQQMQGQQQQRSPQQMRPTGQAEAQSQGMTQNNAPRRRPQPTSQ